MSRDIRSFFQPKKPATKPTTITIDDDDDVIPESPDVQIRNKKKQSRKKRCLSDSDEEIFETKKKKTHSEEPKTSSKKNKTPDKPVLKEVKVTDLFGSGPINRSKPLVKKIAKNTEIGIHSDDEFEKSLLEVDAIEEAAIRAAAIKEQAIKEVKTDLEEPNNKEIEKSLLEKVNDNNPQNSKEIPNKKLNGDSHSQETKSHKSKSHSDSKRAKESYAESKREKDLTNSKKNKDSDLEITKSAHTESKKRKLALLNSERERNTDVKERESHSETKDQRQKSEDESPRKNKNESVYFDKSKKKTPTKSRGESGEGSHEKKRDFSEFMESDVSVLNDTMEEAHHSKKKKMNKSLNDSVLTDEERHERKMYSAALYKSYLNRSGPKHLGAKEIPEGAPNCLANYAFLLTGVLDSFERDEVVAAITKYGGCIKNAVSKKVTHVLAGDDAGPAKMSKAQELGIKIISEDDFLRMIKDSTNKPSTSQEVKHEVKKEKSPSRKTPKKSQDRDRKESKERHDRERKSSKEKERKYEKLEIKESKNSVEKSRSPNKNHEIKMKLEDQGKSTSSTSGINGIISQPTKSSSTLTANTLMWVEKYKPQNLKQIIGQHGDASNVKKLMNWLSKWYVNRKAKLPKPSPWAKNDDGGFYKAALLSGPPGVGKTTTVWLVCRELGFDAVELNASDSRSKALVRDHVGELLSTTSLANYAKGDTGKQAVTKKHVLVMDEVDGMAGNEDRGGLQELISLIKNTSVPIICMCNDRASQKMRSLVNYCYDLRFNRPRVEQIKSAMMSICCKEGVKIPPEALTQLIVASNQDVRQTLNLLSMWAVEPSLLDKDRLNKDASNAKKDVKLGPWEAVRKVFSAEEHKTMTINDKSDLFFYDYSMAPLFVHENYFHVAPHCPKNEILSRIADTADSLSLSDLIDARIRGSQAWNLLPTQAMLSSVIPGHLLSGHVAGQINFPSWLGHNSKRNKMQRLAQEIHAHTRLSTSGSKSSIFLDYAPYLRDAIVTPLLKEKSDGIEKSLEILESYHLLREDLDSLTELSLWPGQRNPLILVDSKIKAAMTRTYNKKALALPYAPGAVRKGRAKDLENDDEDAEEMDEEPDSDPENDALIKKKKKEEKPSAKGKASTSQEKPSTSKVGPSKNRPNAKKKK